MSQTALPGPGRRVLARASQLSRLVEADILGPGRTRLLCRPRYAIAFVMHELGWSITRIGELLGGRDHSTIFNALKHARVMIENDAKFADWVDQLRTAARDVTAFICPVIPFVEVPPPPVVAKPDPEEVEIRERRRRMALGSMLLARAIREYRRAA